MVLKRELIVQCFGEECESGSGNYEGTARNPSLGRQVNTEHALLKHF